MITQSEGSCKSVFLTEHQTTSQTLRACLRNLVLSGLATGASWVYYFRALMIGDASKVAPVDKLNLVLVAVFAFLFLDERPSFREWAGILMIGAGVVILAFKR
jgi:transporter family protein